jgi:hypothetical protein
MQDFFLWERLSSREICCSRTMVKVRILKWRLGGSYLTFEIIHRAFKPATDA